MAKYAHAIQQNFLQDDDEEEAPEPDNAPVIANDPIVQSTQVEPPVEDVTELPAETGLRVDLDVNLDNLFA